MQWIRWTIQSIEERKARSWVIGLWWPTGQPEVLVRSFSIHELLIAYYVRGNVSAEEPLARDENIATLDYMIGAAEAQVL